MTPVRAWFAPSTVVERADASVDVRSEQHADEDERALLPHLDHLNEARREAVSPVERIQHALHGWVAYGAMPLFALANAGVVARRRVVSTESPFRVLLGVAVGLVLGKPLGILAFSWLATRLGVAALPRGVTWPQVGVVGVVAGIGFTMSIFIAQLAFPTGANPRDREGRHPDRLPRLGSLRLRLREDGAGHRPRAEGAATEREAEGSTSV